MKFNHGDQDQISAVSQGLEISICYQYWAMDDGMKTIEKNVKDFLTRSFSHLRSFQLSRYYLCRKLQ